MMLFRFNFYLSVRNSICVIGYSSFLLRSKCSIVMMSTPASCAALAYILNYLWQSPKVIPLTCWKFSSLFLTMIPFNTQYFDVSFDWQIVLTIPKSPMAFSMSRTPPYLGSDWILFFILDSHWFHTTIYSFPKSFWSFRNSCLHSFLSISCCLNLYANVAELSMAPGGCICMTDVLHLASENVTSKPNFSVAYHTRNFSLLFRNVFFILVGPVVNMQFFNS